MSCRTTGYLFHFRASPMYPLRTLYATHSVRPNPFPTYSTRIYFAENTFSFRTSNPTPTRTQNSSDVPDPTLTFVLEPSYKLITAYTNTSANPFFLNAHFITFLGTLSNVFSKSTKHMYSFCSLSRNSSFILLRINNA